MRDDSNPALDGPKAYRSGLNCSLAASHEGSGLHGPALPGMDFRKRANPNFSSNILSETESMGFVEGLVTLQAEAAADNLLLNLSGAVEAPPDLRWPVGGAAKRPHLGRGRFPRAVPQWPAFFTPLTRHTRRR